MRPDYKNWMPKGMVLGTARRRNSENRAYIITFLLQLFEDFSPMDFKLHSEYRPTGDQPEAIKQLVDGFKKGNQFQTLLGVKGSGKTFTMANVIEQLKKPTLVLAHNKTLAAQLYSEFREFFPENAVEYFVSYYVSFY